MQSQTKVKAQRSCAADKHIRKTYTALFLRDLAEKKFFENTSKLTEDVEKSREGDQFEKNVVKEIQPLKNYKCVFCQEAGSPWLENQHKPLLARVFSPPKESSWWLPFRSKQ